MFFGLADMQIVMILLETGAQLMNHLVLALFTMKFDLHYEADSVLLSSVVAVEPKAMSFFLLLWSRHSFYSVSESPTTSQQF